MTNMITLMKFHWGLPIPPRYGYQFWGGGGKKARVGLGHMQANAVLDVTTDHFHDRVLSNKFPMLSDMAGPVWQTLLILLNPCDFLWGFLRDSVYRKNQQMI